MERQMGIPRNRVRRRMYMGKFLSCIVYFYSLVMRSGNMQNPSYPETFTFPRIRRGYMLLYHSIISLRRIWSVDLHLEARRSEISSWTREKQTENISTSTISTHSIPTEKDHNDKITNNHLRLNILLFSPLPLLRENSIHTIFQHNSNTTYPLNPRKSSPPQSISLLTTVLLAATWTFSRWLVSQNALVHTSFHIGAVEKGC